MNDLIAWLPEVPEWVTTLTAWVAALPDWVTKLTEWLPAIPEWVQGLFDWSPSLPDWVNNLLDWSPGMPDWVSKLLGWFGGGGDEGNYATGTPAWPGGWTQVGEFGPELVRLPSGSQIFDHRESAAMLGAVPGQTVTVGPIHINQELDWEAPRWRLQELTRRRG